MKTYKSTFITSLVMVTSIGFSSVSLANNYDLVIKNGRVIDPETGLDAKRWIGISAGKITKISTTSIIGKKTIDATGLVVSPGFIDLHAHGQLLPNARLQAFDGVTTALELEAGVLEVDKFYKNIAKEGRPINYGASANWSMARAMVLDGATFNGVPGEALGVFSLPNWSRNLATKAQQTEIINLVEKAINAGALGVGILAGYSPNSNRKEYYQLHKLAAKYNVSTFNHIRFASTQEPKSAFEAYQELISAAASTGAHAHISHLNSTSARDIEDVAELVLNAQKQGVKISVEAYPYSAASTAIGGQMFRGEHWKERLGNASETDFSFNGKQLTPTSFKELQDNSPRSIIIFNYLDPEHSESDQHLYEISQLFPNGAVASDGMPIMDATTHRMIFGDVWPLPESAQTHPRSAGSYSRFILQFVKESKKISLSEAIRKMSLIPAQILETSVEQMKFKGRIQEGADADIVIFDFAEFTDRATFAKPTLTSKGMDTVIVNGTPIIENGILIRSAMPGKAIRRQIKY
ncbi:amidohydrolase family protein [Pseudocolwellia agarivorans]|uniref:amidohydrolase family protein n=1 Tax=Pseudocolwellia agarivorans TaxID=1911682 RepID=UPI000986DB81|nr:amidohydrolase family protein [Pseudocolwellia agarivorans]